MDQTMMPVPPPPDAPEGKKPADIIAEIKAKLSGLAPEVAAEISPLVDELSTAIGAEDKAEGETEAPGAPADDEFTGAMKKPDSKVFPRVVSDIVKKDLTRRKHEQLKRLYRQQRRLGIAPGASIDFVADFTGMRFTTLYRILASHKMLGKENS